jgi:hypothetical protein
MIKSFKNLPSPNQFRITAFFFSEDEIEKDGFTGAKKNYHYLFTFPNLLFLSFCNLKPK